MCAACEVQLSQLRKKKLKKTQQLLLIAELTCSEIAVVDIKKHKSDNHTWCLSALFSTVAAL